MVPSVTMRPSVVDAVLPAGPSKATFFSSAVSMVPPLEKTSACHIQLPVMSQSKWKPCVAPPSALILRASAKMPSQSAGSCRRIAAGLGHEVGVVIDDRRRDREADAELLAAEAADVEQAGRMTVGLEVGIGGDQRVERLGQTAVEEDALPVEALIGDIGQGVGDGGAQGRLRASS